MNNNNINWDIIFINTLSQDANLFINKKILAKYGCDLALFISFITNQYNYFLTTNQLTENKMFFATDDDIFLFTNMPRTRITTIKKKAQELNLISIKKFGQPLKTYYKVNFELLVSILSTKESIKDLAYNRALSEDELTEEYIRSLTYRELRLLCKKLNISYTKLSTKEDYINKILDEKHLKSQKNKDVSPCAENLHTEEKNLVCGETAHGCAENLTTGVQEICTKYNINQANINSTKTKNHDDELDFFEKLFKEFKINFTKTNKTSVERLRKKLSLKETELYLRETYQAILENKTTKSIPALFSSKISKGERQINSPKTIKKDKNSIKIEEKKLAKTVKTLKKEIVTTPFEEKKTDKILEDFNKLDPYEKLKIEEKSLILLCEEEKIAENFVLTVKQKSFNIYFGMIRKYVEKTMKQ